MAAARVLQLVAVCGLLALALPEPAHGTGLQASVVGRDDGAAAAPLPEPELAPDRSSWAVALGEAAAGDILVPPSLASWLFALEVPIANYSDGVVDWKGSFFHMVCTRLKVDQISCAHKTGHATDTLTVDFEGMSAACRGNFTTRVWEPRREQSGPFTFAINARAKLDVEVYDSSRGLPEGATAGPDVTVTVVDVVGLPYLEFIVKLLSGHVSRNLEAKLSDTLLRVFQGDLTHTLRNYSHHWEPWLAPLAPLPPPSIPTGSASFLDPNNVGIRLVRFASTVLNATFDRLVDDSSTVTSGTVVVPFPFRRDFKFGALDVVFQIEELHVIGLDRFTSIDLVRPVSEHVLVSELQVAELDIELPWRIVARDHFTATTTPSPSPSPSPGPGPKPKPTPKPRPPPVLNETGSVLVTTHNNSIMVNVTLGINMTRARSLSLFDLNRVCVLPAITAFEVTDVGLVFGSPAFRARSNSTGPLENDVVNLINSVMVEALHAFDPQAFAAIVAGLGGSSIRERLNSRVHSNLDANLTLVCAKQSEFVDLTHESLLITLTVGLTGLVAIICAVLHVRRPACLAGSLVMDPGLHWAVRYGILWMLVLSLGLTQCGKEGSMSLGQVRLKYDNGDSQFEDLNELSFLGSLRQYTRAGAGGLAFLSGMCGYGLPALRTALAVACWLLSPRVLGVDRRRFTLRVVLWTGKYLAMPYYLSSLLVAAVRHRFPLPGAEADTFTLQGPAVTEQLVGVCLALAVPALMLHSHRKAVYQDLYEHELQPVVTASRVRQMVFHAFGRSSRLPAFVQHLITGVAAASVVFFVVGLSVPCIRLTDSGAVAVIEDYLQEPTRATFSLWAFATGFMDRAGQDTASVFLTVALMVVCVVFAPLVLGLICLYMWTVSIAPRRLRRWFDAFEVLDSISGIEVFVIAGIAAHFEVHRYVRNTFADRCAGLDAFLKTNFDRALAGQTSCVDVDLQLQSGFFLLLFTALILRLLSDFVRVAVSQHAYPDSLKRQHTKLINIF